MPLSRNAFFERLWLFIRGDMAPRQFESWVCGEPTAEEHLGGALYRETISADFRTGEVVEHVREQLREHARSIWPRICRCVELHDMAVVPMSGEKAAVLRSFVDRTRRGALYWWLSAGQCRACGQWWLIGEDDRYDAFCMRRLDASQGQRILAAGVWPPDFDDYEAMLRNAFDVKRRPSEHRAR